jgi:hypothetical protein
MTLHTLFPPLMIATFLGAVIVLLVGVSGMAGTKTGDHNRSTQLMALRVGLCGVLLLEIIFYITFVR